jgi:DNA-binding response OmpR family regulator
MDTNKKILLVEDDLFLRDIYVETLTTEGYAVTSAQDGEEGLAKLTEGQWDLLLLDLVLPKLDGIQVLKKAKETGTHGNSKRIVILTNNTINDPNKIQEILELSSEYLIKSDMNPQQLLDKVKGFLQ